MMKTQFYQPAVVMGLPCYSLILPLAFFANGPHVAAAPIKNPAEYFPQCLGHPEIEPSLGSNSLVSVHDSTQGKSI